LCIYLLPGEPERGFFILMGPEGISRLHRAAPVVDAHCDALSLLVERLALGGEEAAGQVTPERLKQGGVNLQCFAVFVAPRHRGSYLRRVLEQIDTFYRFLSLYAGELMPVCDQASLEGALVAGKIGAVLCVEGGHVLEGSLSVLRVLRRLGVSCLTLTWNGRNELADGVLESETGGGLTSFGREVVQEMERLGMVVDVAHLAAAGFWDVLSLTRMPVIASHANARALCNHPRNLADEQVRALAARGGVIGVSFVPEFVDPEKPTLERVVDHIEHLAAVGGVACVGLGSDFDGTPQTVAGLEDPSCLPAITEALVRRGWREEDIRKVLGENFLRVFRDVWQ